MGLKRFGESVVESLSFSSITGLVCQHIGISRIFKDEPLWQSGIIYRGEHPGSGVMALIHYEAAQLSSALARKSATRGIDCVADYTSSTFTADSFAQGQQQNLRHSLRSLSHRVAAD